MNFTGITAPVLLSCIIYGEIALCMIVRHILQAKEFDKRGIHKLVDMGMGK